MIYNNLKKTLSPIVVVKNKIHYNFTDGAFVEILGSEVKKYTVKFINDDTGVVIYKTEIQNNSWARTAIKYFIKWRIEVYENDTLISNVTYNAKNKNVLISFDSSSLGDTIAWVPYALEFKNKHNCNVFVRTFKNFLFEEAYPELTFIKPGESVDNLYAKYDLGWFYKDSMEPVLPNTIPLQQTATNILGLEYKELRPRIMHYQKTSYNSKVVTIATNSTAACKFWTREAWQDVITFLHKLGYTIINVSKEENPFENCQPLDDKSLQSAMDAIAHSHFFIGLSSGLSWLAWAMGRPVVMIANFSEEWHEFKCVRPVKKTVCYGCWNNPNFKFDKGDWNWCPVHKNTSRFLECQKSITAQDVISVLLDQILSIDTKSSHGNNIV